MQAVSCIPSLALRVNVQTGRAATIAAPRHYGEFRWEGNPRQNQRLSRNLLNPIPVPAYESVYNNNSIRKRRREWLTTPKGAVFATNPVRSLAYASGW